MQVKSSSACGKLVEKREPERSETDVAPFARSCVELVELGSVDSGVSFRVQIDRNMPLVSVDPVQIRQVLVSLLRNAQPFHRAGPSGEPACDDG